MQSGDLETQKRGQQLNKKLQFKICKKRLMILRNSIKLILEISNKQIQQSHMKWLIKIMKVGLLTFLVGIVCCGLLFIFLKESLLDQFGLLTCCLLYTSDAADDMQCVDLGGRRIIKKKKNRQKTKRL
eukprot:TRINITY_DN13597_c0_g1_i1.p3 TRINITY_DN13597_c0_g1~~TRINITY_DN13597_c0_g1_i1.p3  ORF type:complete len:128 (-),score=11.97 TRINITY_DN13597_c0_g1_i1:72-455(-)